MGRSVHALTIRNLMEQGLSHMARTEGFKGMMKGNGANVIRIVPNSAMKFLCYERMVQYILEQRRAAEPGAEMTPVLRLGVSHDATRDGRSAVSSPCPRPLSRLSRHACSAGICNPRSRCSRGV